MLARWGMIAGISLFVALMAATVIPALFPDTAAVAAPILCANGKMTNKSDTYYPKPGETVVTRTFFCTDAIGTHELETVPTIGACMLIAFVPAFIVLAIALGRTKLERMSEWRAPSQTRGSSMSSSMGKSDSLAERMKELVEARNAGLITEEEFEHKKKAMLDAL